MKKALSILGNQGTVPRSFFFHSQFPIFDRRTVPDESSLLEISPNPIGKVKSQVHPKAPPKNPPPENQGDT